MSTRHQRIADTELNDKHTRILTSLLQHPHNRQCADCEKKDPRWASWNLGIFVCIRCSGTHRSMGTHISKVKSVDLDTWIPEQIDSMVKWGNERANLYWAANLTIQERPTDHTMDQWIRAKYELKKWAQKGPRPEPSTIEIPLPPTPQEREQQLAKEQEQEKRKKEKRLTNPTAELNMFFASSISSPLPQQRQPATVSPTVSPAVSPAASPTKVHHQTEVKAAPLVINPSTSYVNNMSSFQQQLSSLSLGMPSSGFIPKAPPGASSNWETLLGKSSSKTSNSSVYR